MIPIVAGLFRMLLGGLPKVLPHVKDVAEVFAGNRRERERSEFDEQIAIHEEQAEGYSYKAVNRNWFDSFIDGVNRLPRPMYAFLCMALFVWPVFDPVNFAITMRALDTIPQMLWTVIAMILGFYFGSRLLAKDLAKGSNDRVSAQRYFDKASGAPAKGAAEVAASWKPRPGDLGQ